MKLSKKEINYLKFLLKNRSGNFHSDDFTFKLYLKLGQKYEFNKRNSNS